MFCEKCGTQLEEGAVFCQNCGTAIGNNTQNAQVQPTTVAQVPNKKKNPLGWVIAGIVAVVVIVLAVVLMGGNKVEKTVNKFFKAFEYGEMETLITYTYPKEVLARILYEEEMDLDDFADEYDSWYDEIEDLEWEIKRVENLEKLNKLEDDMEDYCDISDLDEFKDYMDEAYGEYGLNADMIQKAYAVKVKVRAEVDGERESETIYDVVYKYKGKWYVAGGFEIIY